MAEPRRRSSTKIREPPGEWDLICRVLVGGAFALAIIYISHLRPHQAFYKRAWWAPTDEDESWLVHVLEDKPRADGRPRLGPRLPRTALRVIFSLVVIVAAYFHLQFTACCHPVPVRIQLGIPYPILPSPSYGASLRRAGRGPAEVHVFLGHWHPGYFWPVAALECALFWLPAHEGFEGARAPVLLSICFFWLVLGLGTLMEEDSGSISDLVGRQGSLSRLWGNHRRRAPPRRKVRWASVPR